MKRPPQPTSDASWCVSQFFDYLEIRLRNRVIAKTGRKQLLNWGKLSNINGNAAAAHPSKPKSPLLPGSNYPRAFQLDYPIEFKQKLREVFLKYCGWGEKLNFMFMSRSQFLRFCRDANFLSEGLDMTALTLVFEKTISQSGQSLPPPPSPPPAPGHSPLGARLSLQDWTRAVVVVAQQLQPGAASMDPAVVKFIEAHVFPLIDASPPEADAASGAVLLPEVVEALEGAKSRLAPVWQHYVLDQEFRDAKEMGLSEGDLADAKRRMPLPSFLRFASDFEVTPGLLSKVQLTEAFRAAGSGASGAAARDPDALPLRLSFPEFQECLIRCALTSFKYALPGKASAPVIRFVDNYQTAAKNLWLQEDNRLRSGIDAQDGLQLPAAVRDHGMSSEELPCYDGVGPGGGGGLAAAADPSGAGEVGRSINGYGAGGAGYDASFVSGNGRGSVAAAVVYDDEAATAAGRAATAHMIGRAWGQQQMLQAAAGAGGSFTGMSAAGRTDASAAAAAAPNTHSPGGGDGGAYEWAHFSEDGVEPSLRGGGDGGGGRVEMLEVHAEPSQMVRAGPKPPHLASFSLDWIAKPGLPLNEARKLRPRQVTPTAGSGTYYQSLNYPPVFTERAHVMFDARVSREQHLELLSLRYQAERQQQQRDLEKRIQGRRKQLEVAAGQSAPRSGVPPRYGVGLGLSTGSNSNGDDGSNRISNSHNHNSYDVNQGSIAGINEFLINERM